ncbi:MAG: MepB domain containing protein [Gammaproteobacteria bacterium RIFCSPHIGHO2_12_FULL_35_23]|nr:MAG: MepB domain containing protein [Gammaproteobacteria bacterium RIFCSPHIGHO2_12_FULL_35_23]
MKEKEKLFCQEFRDSGLIPSDLLAIKNLIFKPANFKCTKPVIETESSEYGACTFKLNALTVKFRVAKITPTKSGQFVALWKRVGKTPIQPFDSSDQIDLVIICVRKDNHFGQFIFPKSVLLKQNIFSTKGRGGKRAIRVYPPWDKTLNNQAQKTQKWQIDYFLEVARNNLIQFQKLCALK